MAKPSTLPTDNGYLLIFLFLAVAPALLIAELVSGEKPSRGQQVCASKCADCPGADGKAETKVGEMTQTPDLTASSWEHGISQAEVEKIIQEGAGRMEGCQERSSRR